MNSKKICPMGVDLGSGYLRVVQLGQNEQGLFLQSASLKANPKEAEFGSPAWQHWAADNVRDLVRGSDFRGKSVITAIPSDKLFIDPIRIPKNNLKQINEILPQKLQKRLPFPIEKALFQHVIIGGNEQNGSDIVDILAISANREDVNRHLAIFEKAGLEVAGISIWPTAMVQSFKRFFCRRKNGSGIYK